MYTMCQKQCLNTGFRNVYLHHLICLGDLSLKREDQSKFPKYGVVSTIITV